jgi:hypothetical protein
VATPGIPSRLWLAWLAILALGVASVVVPTVAGPAQARWSHERTVVLTFAVTLIAMVLGIGSLALRETLVRGISTGRVDPRSAEGAVYVQAILLRAWALCGGVGLLGGLVAWIAAAPPLAWPYVVAATALLLFHAPRPSALDPP